MIGLLSLLTLNPSPLLGDDQPRAASGTLDDPIVDSAMTRAEALAGLDPGCPEEIRDRQVVIDLHYFSFDQKIHRGQLVVDRDLEQDVRPAFQVMLESKFPLQSVIPVSDPRFRKDGRWSDDLSMAANNTSAFNYRPIAGTVRLSNHASGRAIDINPRQNPYIKGQVVQPPGAKYEPNVEGTLTKEHPVVKAFLKMGWEWGGHWKTTRDYQHLEKPNRPVKTSTHVLQVGETKVNVSVSEARGSSLLYVNLHDDEDTSAQAGLEVLRRTGGRLIELRHSGLRDVRFALGGQTYRFDPNRIFTRRGIEQSLAKLSQRNDEAERAVAQFAEDLLKLYQIDRADAVIALHNNGGRSYSVRSYMAGQDLAGDAEEVFIAPARDPSDFDFVTERPVFEALRGRGHNVVLQDNRRVTDDGSLSVYCGRAKKRYINVEAKHGHLSEQVKMLHELGDVLRELGHTRPQ